MLKVSVIIPAYNAETYIERCASSVLRQTLKDIEIIFIDDGSTDRTGVILDFLTLGYDNACVIHQENQGLYKSREIGLSIATGEYVGWVDADDYIEYDMYEVLYNTAIENDSELVICNYSWFPKPSKIKNKWFRKYNGKIDTTFVEQNSQVWNKLVKRDLLTRLNIGSLFVSCFDEAYIRVLLEAKSPVTIEKSLYHYRVKSGTMSSSYKNVVHYREFVEASKELRTVMHPFIKSSYWKDYFDYRVIYYLLVTMAVAANTGYKESYEQNRKELFSMKPPYNKNQHFWKILTRNFGKLKAALFGRYVSKNYMLACFICKVAFTLMS